LPIIRTFGSYQLTQASIKRVAAITGGAQGLGRAIAQRFGQDGYSLVLCDVSAPHLERAVTEMSASGLTVQALEVDVSDEASVRRMRAHMEHQFGRLDVLVNSAGVLGLIDNKAPKVEDTPLSVWERVLKVNLTGPFLVCREMVPLMRKSGAGRIINIASRAARVRSGDPAYSASKSGLVGFSRVLAGDLAPDGITVNCIAPSYIPTGLVASMELEGTVAASALNSPLGRIGVPDDIAGAAAFLASKDASFITGAIIDVNGGSFMQG